MRILIAEDQILLRDTLKITLSQEKDFTIVGTAENGKKAVEMAKQLKPDLILMDLKMPLLDGLQAAALIKEKQPEIRILFLTLYENDADLMAVIKVGGDGFLLKDVAPETLIMAIRSVEVGLSVFNKKALSASCQALNNLQVPPLSTTGREELTPSEREVVQRICRGMKNREIAEELNLSLGTVKNRIGSILGKTNLTDRTQIVVFALKNGLLK